MRNGNFRLKAGSPAINIGTDVLLTSDFLGYVVHPGSAPGIGGYDSGYDIPILTIPADDATGGARPAAFTREAPAWATLYNMKVVSDSGFNDVIVDVETEETSFEIDADVMEPSTYITGPFSASDCKK